MIIYNQAKIFLLLLWLGTMIRKFGDVSNTSKVECRTGLLKLTNWYLSALAKWGLLAPFASLYL
jgi:hypothetical protein